MQDTVLYLDSASDPPASIWPWVVAVVAATLLALTVVDTARHIPASIADRAKAAARSLAGDSLSVAVDGRDLTLTGTIHKDIDRTALIERMRSIDGVRVVTDRLGVFDPEEQRRLSQQAFRDALRSIQLGQIAFQSGSTTLTGNSGRAIDEIARLMQTHPDVRIRIGGHTDNTGRADANIRISRERATAVAQALTARGIDASRLIVQGYGSTQPIADNATESGRARNRRIEISYVD